MGRVVIGIVGYCEFIRGYPLGPGLMARLRAGPWPQPVEIREMNWGPIAIVQDFQASAEKYDRVVLVGAVDRGLAPGTVICRRWAGRVQDAFAVQRRVFEAVTGVISMDNLLVIGAHFGVWPDQLITVEVQLSQSSLGDFVLAEIEAGPQAGQPPVIGERALTPGCLELVERIVEMSRCAALDGAAAAQEVVSLATAQLTPVARVCHYDFMNEGRYFRPADGQEQAQ